MSKGQHSNVTRLVIERMSQMMIDRNKPAADGGFGLTAAIGVDIMNGKLGADYKEARQWVDTALRAVKEAPGGDQYGDDEAIAGEILRQIEARRNEHNSA